MDPQSVKNALIKELTGRDPQHKTGMILGFGFSLGALAFLGAMGYLAICINNEGEPEPGGFFVGAVSMVCLGFFLSWLGDRMGWLESEIDREAIAALTYDEEDFAASYGFKDWNYDARRNAEVEGLAFAAATFQFLIGTLWVTLRYLFMGDNIPEEGLRGATAVVMYLQKSGRVDQDKLTRGLKESGLPEQDTRKGLTFLKVKGLVIGNAEGFLLSEKGKKLGQNDPLDQY